MVSSERNGRNEAAVRRTSARVSGENAKVRRPARKPVSDVRRKKAEKADGPRRQHPKEGQSRKLQVWKLRLAVAGGGLAAIVIVYCLIAANYRNRFLPNTFVNGFAVGSLSAADTEEILKQSVEDYQLEVGFRGGKNEMITSRDIDLTYVSSNEVSGLLAGQKRLNWHEEQKSSLS